MTIAKVKPAGWVDGETLTAAQVNQIDTNLTYAVDGNTTTSAGLTIASRSVTRVLCATPAFYAPSAWLVGCPGSNNWLCKTVVNTQTVAAVPVHVPNGATITQSRVYVRGPTGHGALPGSTIATELTRYKISTGAGDMAMGAGIDGSATVGAYEVVHPITMSGLGTAASIVDNTQYRYAISVTSESGTCALAGSEIYGADVTYTTTRLDED
jgi:hypothetical protein